MYLDLKKFGNSYITSTNYYCTLFCSGARIYYTETVDQSPAQFLCAVMFPSPLYFTIFPSNQAIIFTQMLEVIAFISNRYFGLAHTERVWSGIEC
jgi:hypothetical protein